MKYKMLVMDVDGTLTDGRLYYSADGEAMKAFDVKDGYGLVSYIKAGGIPVVITGRRSEIVEQRCRELGITEVYQGASDKLEVLKETAQRMNVLPADIAYIGDDLNDLDGMHFCGFSACPSDAVDAVRLAADHVCRHEGGRGAVREVVDLISALSEVGTASENPGTFTPGNR